MHTMQFIRDIPAANRIAILFLTAASYYDIRYHKIPKKFISLTGIGTISYVLLQRHGSIGYCLGGATIGILLLMIGRVTGESIGYGDGAAFVITGLLFGVRQNMVMFCISLIFSALCSLWILLCRNGNRKTEIPFLPCMLAGCIVISLWGIQ